MEGEEVLDAVGAGGRAYVRNLAAAEEMVRRGQFNVAKVLRALAHAQRAFAWSAAHQTADEIDAVALLRRNVAELRTGGDEVRVRALGIATRALDSLASHPDVPESAVAQRLWGCYGCGCLVEGDQPDSCPVCGALGVEFESFGPFYAHTPEHLGQRSPAEVVSALRAAPGELASAVAGRTDAELGTRPAADEWSAKEIIGHLVETDRLFVRRVGTILATQDIPALDPSAPWTLHEGKGYPDLDGAQLLAHHREARNATLVLVSGLAPRDWSRSGTLRGTANSVLDLGSWLANHDAGHLAQLRRPR